MTGHMKPESLYKALTSRDRRFDGRVFFGVKSTGIYCRPICPAKTPLAKNVEFFPTAAAAEQSGYRACMRCRPETSPGTPAWSGSLASVSRALRRISAGAIQEKGVTGLAEELGMSERHLSRLFAEHLGAPPHAIDLVRRLDLARQMVDNSDLSITEIAIATGFDSIRRFNDAFLKRFARSPSALRKAQTVEGSEGMLTWRLAYRPPFAGDSLFSFLAKRALTGVEAGDAKTYRRTVRLKGGPTILVIRHLPERHAVEVSVPSGHLVDLLDVSRRVRCLLDLDADPMAIVAQWKGDPILAAELKRAPGLRVPGCWDGFELAVRAIVGQQVSVEGARTVTSRLVERFGEPVSIPAWPELNKLFPTPAAFASAGGTGWGMPEARAQTIRTLAAAVARGEISLEPDADPIRVREQLVALPGIGPWTAEYVAMRALRDPDAFPFSDLVVKREVKALGAKVDLESWRPWRAYAVIYLWNRAGFMEAKK